VAGITRPTSFGPHCGAPYGDFTGRTQPDRTIGVLTQPYAFGAHASRAYTFAPTVEFEIEVLDPIVLTATLSTSADITFSSDGEFAFTPPLDIPQLLATLSVAADLQFTTGPEVPRSVGPLTTPLAFGAHTMQRYDFGRFAIEVLAPIAMQATLSAAAPSLASGNEDHFSAAGRRARQRRQTAAQAGVGSIQFNKMQAASMLAEQERSTAARDDADVQAVLLAVAATGRIM